MVMLYAPVRDAVQAFQSELPAACRRVVLSAQGRTLNQSLALELSMAPGLVVVAGRYEGIDERISIGLGAEEISIGDYVLSGGELAAAVLIDTVVRLLPGVLGHEDSPAQESFVAGLLDYPHFTRPELVDGLAVPPVLLSGDHELIRRWRRKESLGRTWLRRPELLAGRRLDAEDEALLREFQVERDTG
jgi:tRNA (guanine37-N1)-methyltransferase